jgi:hypothetical protein
LFLKLNKVPSGHNWWPAHIQHPDTEQIFFQILSLDFSISSEKENKNQVRMMPGGSGTRRQR